MSRAAPLAPLPASPLSPTLPASVLDDADELQQYTRFEQSPQGVRLAESGLVLAGMHCAACADTLEAALQAVPGVVQARVSAASHRATVRWDPARVNATSLFRAVRQAGYEAAPDTGAAARALRLSERRMMVWRLFVAGFCSMQIMMLAWPSYITQPGEMEADLAQLLNWSSWVLSLPLMAFSALPFLRGAWRSLRARRIGMDVPVSLGVLVCFVASTGATFAPGGFFGTEVYFDSLSMFVSFLLGARQVELQARHRAAQTLEDALDTMPETAHREAADGQVEAVSLRQLRVGDVVQVRFGDAFPADGLLLEGHALVDEALLTGESSAVARHAGDAVVAGSFNRGATVRVKVQAVGEGTQRAAILQLMRQASTQRPASTALADRWAGPFLWAVLVLAALGGLAWSVIDPARAVWVVVAVLVVTCPCALSLATPATLVAAAAGLARRGVLVRDLSALERLAEVDTVMLDKTGTLTDPVADMSQVHVWREDLLQSLGTSDPVAVAAALASQSSHPVARSLMQAAQHAGLQAVVLHEVRELAGFGITGQDAHGRWWRFGAAPWACEPAQAVPDARAWLGVQGQAVAAFSFREQLRAGAAEAVAALRADGLQLRLLSGDAGDRVHTLANELALDQAQGQASPQDKLRLMAQAQAEGHVVAMVGDGVNDAPVLARADVSLAMGHGAAVAQAQADLLLTNGHLEGLILARRTGRLSRRIVRQNLVWALVYNAACIPLALLGYLPPWAAGLGMALSSLGVVLNALRAGRVANAA